MSDTREEAVKTGQIETIVNRIMYILNNPDISGYSKRDTVKKLVEMLEPEKRTILAFAVEMTPTAEQIAKEKANQFPETKGK